MARRDLHHNFHVVNANPPSVHAASTDVPGTAVDLQGYDACEFVISGGALHGNDRATDQVTVVIQERHLSTGTWTTVADIDLIGSQAGAALEQDPNNSIKKVGYIGSRRYVRINVANAAGGTSAASVMAFLGYASRRPV